MPSTAAPFAVMTDEQLMLRVQADDDRAFERLYDRHRDRVWQLAQVLYRPPDRADAVVEEAFIAMWNERAAYDPGRETVQAWTMRLAYRRAGARAPQNPGKEDLPKPGSTSAGRGPHRDDNAAVPGLRALLDRLPAEERDIIALAFYGGLNHAQIAELLGLAPGTVKGRMRLGLHKLRGIMDEGQQADENPSG